MVGRKVHNDAVIYAVDEISTIGIQALQHREEKCEDCKEGLCLKVNLIWSHSIKIF